MVISSNDPAFATMPRVSHSLVASGTVPMIDELYKGQQKVWNLEKDYQLQNNKRMMQN